ncbi:unnamed protein product [Vitrella brassicaformis CCMP3155]|uniref:SH3 domain-containing protein n=1 Tax=Vitrella brassicaformis (strain CCMP3155) TaxID=1169540 RepID=A0A0G4FQZ4_VITBC|nr:unnamed protein product [Vitrella brassicaformis CCMP3155]|eukprot:CEM16879.1 unnamed protein product [Vitrella brassicaformis CCMP3155]
MVKLAYVEIAAVGQGEPKQHVLELQAANLKMPSVAIGCIPILTKYAPKPFSDMPSAEHITVFPGYHDCRDDNVPIILTLRKGEHRTDARNTIATVYKNVFFEDKGIGSIRSDGARVTCRGPVLIFWRSKLSDPNQTGGKMQMQLSNFTLADVRKTIGEKRYAILLEDHRRPSPSMPITAPVPRNPFSLQASQPLPVPEPVAPAAPSSRSIRPSTSSSLQPDDDGPTTWTEEWGDGNKTQTQTQAPSTTSYDHDEHQRGRVTEGEPFIPPRPSFAPPSFPPVVQQVAEYHHEQEELSAQIEAHSFCSAASLSGPPSGVGVVLDHHSYGEHEDESDGEEALAASQHSLGVGEQSGDGVVREERAVSSRTQPFGPCLSPLGSEASVPPAGPSSPLPFMPMPAPVDHIHTHTPPQPQQGGADAAAAAAAAAPAAAAVPFACLSPQQQQQPQQPPMVMMEPPNIIPMMDGMQEHIQGQQQEGQGAGQAFPLVPATNGVGVGVGQGVDVGMGVGLGAGPAPPCMSDSEAVALLDQLQGAMPAVMSVGQAVRVLVDTERMQMGGRLEEIQRELEAAKASVAEKDTTVLSLSAIINRQEQTIQQLSTPKPKEDQHTQTDTAIAPAPAPPLGPLLPQPTPPSPLPLTVSYTPKHFSPSTAPKVPYTPTARQHSAAHSTITTPTMIATPSTKPTMSYGAQHQHNPLPQPWEPPGYVQAFARFPDPGWDMRGPYFGKFDGNFLHLEVGDVICPTPHHTMEPPAGSMQQGWALGRNSRTHHVGWYPESYVRPYGVTARGPGGR